MRGSMAGRPLLLEHDHAAKVGQVVSSWKGTRGELRVCGHIEDRDVASKVRSGQLRGLSLGTAMMQTDTGRVLYRGQDELSICTEGRRPGTWIDEVDGKTVHTQFNASKGQRALFKLKLSVQRSGSGAGSGSGSGSACAAPTRAASIDNLLRAPFC